MLIFYFYANDSIKKRLRLPLLISVKIAKAFQINPDRPSGREQSILSPVHRDYNDIPDCIYKHKTQLLIQQFIEFVQVGRQDDFCPAIGCTPFGSCVVHNRVEYTFSDRKSVV